MRYVRLLLPFVAILSLFSCDEFSLIDQFYVDTMVPPRIYPPVTDVSPAESRVFVVYGGVPSYHFEVIDPGGGTIDPVTGEYTAPDTPGEFTVRVVDRAGRSSDATVHVRIPPTLTISPPSASLVSDGASLQFSATGGVEPYVFGVINSVPADPPVGTIVPDTGWFTPSEPGSITVVVTDDAGSTAYASVYVYDTSGSALTVTASANPIQQGASVTLQVAGGIPDYSIEAVPEDLLYNAGPGIAEMLNPTSGLGVYVASDSIGTVRVLAVDSPGPEQQTAGVIITIVPVPPTAFAATGTVSPPNASIALSWQYDRPDVQGFRIQRRPVSGGSTEVYTITDPAARDYPWPVPWGNRNTLYRFWITAYYGSYESPPATLEASASGGQQ